MTQINELLQRASALDYGPEQVAFIEEAVRQADLLHDEEIGYQVRKSLIRATNYAGEGDKMMIAFSWCIRYLDNHQAEFGPWEVRHMAWLHKWVLMSALDFPQIPWERIQELHADYARRAQALGTPASIPYFGMQLEMHRGNAQAACEQFDLWKSQERDSLSDCSACEAQAIADLYLLTKGDAEAVQESEHILGRHQSCTHIPHNTYAGALLPMLRLNLWEKAAEYSLIGRKMVAHRPDYLSAQAAHLAYLAVADPQKGLKWYARHVQFAENSREFGEVARFHNAAALLFGVLALRSERPTRKLNLPPSARGYQESGVYSVSERRAYHEAEARHIAALFDERNGTPYHTERLAQTLALAQLQPPKEPTP